MINYVSTAKGEEPKNQSAVEAGRTAIMSELASVRMEMDKDNRMLKSLYESLVNGVISGDEYRDMRVGYEAKIADRLSRAGVLERRQSDLEAQVADYYGFSDLISGVSGSSDFTAKMIDGLIERIRVFSDRRIEVDFRFSSGFEKLWEELAI